MIDRELPYDGFLDNPLGAMSSEQLYEALNADEWIRRHRSHNDGRLDIAATAESLDIPVHMPEKDATFTAAKAWITGLRPDTHGEPIEISFGTTTRDNQLAISFGHELGHYFIFQHGLTPDHTDAAEENFCEYFGKQVALPKELLTDVEGIDGELVHAISERFAVETSTAILQLIELGKLPRRVFIDSGVGPTKNPIYNNKIERVVVCADCEAGIPHDTQVDAFSEEHVVLDMTAYDLANGFSMHDCTPEMTFDLENLKRINLMYGRWADEDEARVKEANAEHAERLKRMWTTIGKIAFDDQELF